MRRSESLAVRSEGDRIRRCLRLQYMREPIFLEIVYLDDTGLVARADVTSIGTEATSKTLSKKTIVRRILGSISSCFRSSRTV